MATALVGTLAAFDSQSQAWEEYIEVMEHFFVANEITEAERKRAILLSSVGSRTYSLMRNLLSPEKPGDMLYDDLTDLLQSHYNPKPSEIVQRFKFNSRTRAVNETVTEYVAVLRELAQHCNYGDKLKEMLRDRLVCGIADDRIQRRLLAEPDLTFERVLKVAQAIETASRDVRDLQLQPKTMDKQKQTTLQEVLSENKDVFKEELGTWRGPPAKIYVKEGVAPKYYKPRPVPYAMRKKVEGELQRLTNQGIIEPVKFSEWAAPIVPVLKPDNSVRICGDYKLTVNLVSKLEQYPIPKLEDLFEKLSGGEKFSKLDLSHAYQQVILDETSKPYVTINTHKGLFQVNRLPFGVSSSPAIFQRLMESLVAGIPNVEVYLDDILLTGQSDQEHLASGIWQEFLGYKVDASGLHPLPHKVSAIQKAPAPTNVTELRAYLGLLNYYNRFLPNLSTLLAPLHELLKKETKWKWATEQERAFEDSKRLMQSSEVLVHYDSQKDLILSCDASPYGVGTVLSHRMPGGQERPISFMSRTLTSAESNYSQLDKEGLAVMFGIQRFHKYLYGRKFVICTDHKPLLSLFNEMKAVPNMASPRIQRWAVTLRAYEYEIIYKPGKHHGNADAMSRLPLPQPAAMVEQEERVLMMETVTLVWTNRDPVLSRVAQFIQHGWSMHDLDPGFQPYSVRKTELSVQDGCVLWGSRVVVPPPGREAMLQQLHHGHIGITRMKALARSYFWWPKLDADIETAVKSCVTCQEHRNLPAPAPLHPWEWPSKPWQRLHIDYVGPFMGHMFLILMDAHSKWMDAYPVTTSTSTITIECLRKSFSSQGIPETIVSDNGSCFVSAEFKDFLEKNGIEHITSAPYHASSNGCAERAVQTFKAMLKKAVPFL
ncbi:uncharacterized protein K02A2.6-like [Cololabis saira]|uniref:uncharacterized protein K02A2.6-like n=1 Tax=Cololabis saira TaxID=129043 RepID=UPI002AD231F2|nr:uncharacterized protein K02A2.6-like [Cololabis saira]